jgi:hypothetical protein
VRQWGTVLHTPHPLFTLGGGLWVPLWNPRPGYGEVMRLVIGRARSPTQVLWTSLQDASFLAPGASLASWWLLGVGDMPHLGGTGAEPALLGREMPRFLHKQPGLARAILFLFPIFTSPLALFSNSGLDRPPPFSLHPASWSKPRTLGQGSCV